MSLPTILNALGGLALFLLAMQMMTDGLKIFAGGGLRKLLARWTSTPLRGVLSGVLVTGLVQSSSAVTVATIGFVNAGILSLRQALGVVFGTNIGTTITSWLVSLVGGGFKIDAFAMPILTVGVALGLTAPGKKYKGLGAALAGFGLFFLGLSILKDAFSGMAEAYGAGVADGGGLPAFFIIGFIATLLTQSSSAAIAIILTAVGGGVIGIEPAAGAIIGASLGTTTTAAFAVIKATSNAKRLALGHILFNVITGAVALLLLPLLMLLISNLSEWLDLEKNPIVTLALFHTTFKILGVTLLLPFTGKFAGLLERAFRSAEEDLGKPRHLDSTLSTTPTLAVSALQAELRRLRDIVTQISSVALLGTVKSADDIERQSESVRHLGEAIVKFVAGVRTEKMAEEVGNDLTQGLQIWRYLDQSARLAPYAYALRQDLAALEYSEAKSGIEAVLENAIEYISLQQQADSAHEAFSLRLELYEGFEETYEKAKTGLLTAAVGRNVSITRTESLLDNLSMTRRLVQQLVQADGLLRKLERRDTLVKDAHEPSEILSHMEQDLKTGETFTPEGESSGSKPW